MKTCCSEEQRRLFYCIFLSARVPRLSSSTTVTSLNNVALKVQTIITLTGDIFVIDVAAFVGEFWAKMHTNLCQHKIVTLAAAAAIRC